MIAFLQELAENKEKLLRFFLTDQTLVDLLTGQQNTPLPALGLRYSQVFPYHWLDGTITDQKSFLCFSVVIPRAQSPSIKDVEMKVWLFSHDAIMRTPKGPRIDLIASAVDSLLNGGAGMGIGKAGLLGTREISPGKDFYGYELRYMVKDFNRSFSAMRDAEVRK